ncbi:FAD-dependent monooxygenase [Limnohabitans radicicola]|uniref:FAD-dependent monooxygenase n=1 Tax=Limnohabitans radicicola TaxID=2771427 RepID=A0A927FJW6_9BURK|nr:FAD-dependent monooxygenase [Limnohabitans radicicola]MBD8051812.1 FAD-dependent monooxygenase [Limnohabitans radicicola]
MTWQATDILVAGGGIGGLAAGVALARTGASVRLIERSERWGEVGAGIQIGPNVTRILQGWGFASELAQLAAMPTRLQARDARTGQVLGTLPLGERSVRLYGAPYACIHRADLHALLLAAATRQGVDLQLGQGAAGLTQQGDALTLQTDQGECWTASALVGADGLWSRTRAELGLTDAPRFSGHLAYRALVPQDSLPAQWRTDQVTVWMGPRLHVVHYPVQAGRGLNLVAIVHGSLPADAQSWDAMAQPASLFHALGPVATELRERLQAMQGWRLWALHDRPPLSGPAHMARGHVALLGDAAHPMRPYLAQGAGMAIEDANALAEAWIGSGSVAERLHRYAQVRWQRNARVQARAIRNGEIFHAQGPVAWGRNASMRLLGERVMDVPWLYAGP